VGQRPGAEKKNYVPDEVRFRTKSQIALELIERVLTSGVRVKAWTFDEFYGRDRDFLDGLAERGQAFVAEVPVHFHGWLEKPRISHVGPKRKRPTKHPRVVRRRPSCEVRNLLKHSPVFREQAWQPYRIKDTHKGPEVWKVKWAHFWRKEGSGAPRRRHRLIVACNVLTGEVKYFVSNRLPGQAGFTLRCLLRIAFGRWSVESCFREAKEELGLDHYEVRGWRCIHRHFYITQLSHLFCARVRQAYDAEGDNPAGRLSVEQVRSAMNVWLAAADLPPAVRCKHYQQELDKQDYYQRRNAQACRSHTKRRTAVLRAHGIDIDRIKSCIP
jgi:SRSO17 transposase